jgi:hypothetical protein
MSGIHLALLGMSFGGGLTGLLGLLTKEDFLLVRLERRVMA